jgi:glutaredoxin
MLKDFLNQNQLAFSEKLVDQDDSAREEMTKESGGFLGVPFTVIVKDDGVKETVFGFDKEKIKKILNI